MNGLKKYRKALIELQNFCSASKKVMEPIMTFNVNLHCYVFKHFTTDRIHKEKVLTDYERGYIAGRHAAFNDVLKELHIMLETSESYWK